MSVETVELGCVVCGEPAEVELGRADGFALACEACGTTSLGEYRPETGTIRWH